MYPEKKFLGVCSWLSIRFDVDITLVRLIFIGAVILGLGSPIIIYFILYLVKPNTSN
ncbi:MAG: PspC domain-containing protein [Bacteroidetes bacterium]|nr:MAG: PspC domain-containing protein [Bacteroidota bacterium]